MNNIDIDVTSRQGASLAAVGVERLNDMQLRTLDAFRGGGDVVVLSPTGTGKTLAYLLPLLEVLCEDVCSVQAVVVLPTRELARQVADVWKLMAAGFRAVCLHGGWPYARERGCHALRRRGGRPARGRAPAVQGTPGHGR